MWFNKISYFDYFKGPSQELKVNQAKNIFNKYI